MPLALGALGGHVGGVTSRRSFLTRSALLAAGVGGALLLREHVLWPSPRVTFVGEGGSSGWLPYVERRALTPTIRVRIGDQEITALVDSGAQYSVIDRGLFAELGLTKTFGMPLIAYGVGGGAQVGRGTTLDVTAGDMAISGLRVAILDLGPLADAAGLSTPLILGQDVLGETVLELDGPERRVNLWDRARHQLWPEAAAVPVRRRGGALTTEVSIEGATTTVLIDTGASSLLALSRETATTVGLLDGRAARQGESLVLGGVTQAAVVKAQTVTFGETLFRDVEVAIFADVAAPGFPDGLLGMEAMRGRRAALNLSAGTLHLARSMDVTVGGPGPARRS